MIDLIQDIHGIRVLVCAPEGAPLATEQDALDLIGLGLGEGADLVAMPVGRLSADFFHLRTGLAGAIVQKFVNYGLRLVILEDLSARLAQSASLRAFVVEANAGTHLNFVADLAALEEMLGRVPGQ